LAAQQNLTTIILVRHAEKASEGKDPALTPEGMGRAASLSRLLSSTNVTAIYSTKYVRTQSTVQSLAHAKGLTIENYDPSKFDYLDEILKKHAGGVVVICGHSNTVPGAANYLLGNNELKNFEDSDYENLLVVTLSEKGKGKLLWMKY
jgi:broad specificity phosphatase PhoE